MKKLVFIITLCSLSFSQLALACKSYEAQFVGFISIAKTTADGCELDIDFDLYNPHMLCPLLKEEALSTPIVVDKDTCNSVANTHTGGYLVSDLENGIISLEVE